MKELEYVKIEDLKTLNYLICKLMVGASKEDRVTCNTARQILQQYLEEPKKVYI